ncbi:hypothetical protein B0H17DRAFT_1043214 [Mycena rosella]|uniref:Secreted protein n=1 Tax=Mycena rosella TaxID=1033263 RepID=A0AAD7E0P1_MYCRO|nr:hypothetical protein B0H17DRAFT_1043214 [Mycena rosella]
MRRALLWIYVRVCSSFTAPSGLAAIPIHFYWSCSESSSPILRYNTRRYSCLAAWTRTPAFFGKLCNTVSCCPAQLELNSLNDTRWRASWPARVE